MLNNNLVAGIILTLAGLFGLAVLLNLVRA